ncbi:MAG: mandelate racemase [Hyphomicrobiales bacterium]|nr:MAG: mandelate racemase [Hyphomicrobiales bacterium]
MSSDLHGDAARGFSDKIDRIEIHEYGFDVEGLGRDSHLNLVSQAGARMKMTNFAVVMSTGAGARGEYCPMHGGKKAMLAQVLMLAPLLIGRDPAFHEALYDDMKRAQRQWGFLGVGALDIALWDLRARAAGLSVSAMLGACRSRLPAYVSTIHADRNGNLSSKEAFATFALEARELGFPGFKIHGWSEGNRVEEAENVLHLRAQVGDGMALMLDPACELKTFADTLYVGQACDEAKYFWLEDPMRDAGTSQHAHRKLRQMIRTPILATEHVRGVEAKADWIAAEATDFVRADPDLDLGISGCMRIARIAEGFGLDVEIHGVGPAHRHCMAAIRNTNFYELALVAPGVRNPVPPVFTCGYSEQMADVGPDGCYAVPDGPGLGVQHDWDFIARNRIATHVFE